MSRKGRSERKTRETDIVVNLDLDGKGSTEIATGLPFFDHMLELMFRHAMVNIEIEARGDLEVDGHHTVEDTGLATGKALKEALGDKRGINRFGSSLVPMDECLSEVAVDVSGRPLLVYVVELAPEPLGNFDPELARDFFTGMVNEAGLTLHITLKQSGGVHHGLESVFKAVGRALRTAVEPDPRSNEIPSTKGTL